MSVRAVGANRLAIGLLRSQPSNKVGTKKKADQQRSDRRPPRSEGDVAEEVESLKLIRERKKQRVEHSIMSLAAPIPHAAARRCGQAQRRGSPSPSRHRRTAKSTAVQAWPHRRWATSRPAAPSAE